MSRLMMAETSKTCEDKKRGFMMFFFSVHLHLFIIIALILVGTNIPLVNRESNLLPLPADMRLYCNMRHSTSLKCTIKI